MDGASVAVRAAAARKFLEAALLYGSGAAAELTVSGSNAVSAGIAASDAICGKVLGYCSQGQDHRQALELLEKATQPNAAPRRNLERLLDNKSLAQYGTSYVTPGRARDLLIYAERLVDVMEQLLAS